MIETIKAFIESLLKLGQDFFGPLGGPVIVIAGIISFYANRLAERNLEELKNKHSKEIELYRTRLETAKSSQARYSEQQFNSYNQLWSSLYELKTAGNKLWEHANRQNLYQFANQLRNTHEMVEKNSLFIEDAHFEQLEIVLKAFSEFEFGKKRLIELRRQDHVDPYEIDQLIEHNRQFLKQYTQLIADIRKSFRQQLNVKIDD